MQHPVDDAELARRLRELRDLVQAKADQVDGTQAEIYDLLALLLAAGGTLLRGHMNQTIPELVERLDHLVAAHADEITPLVVRAA
ncbi:MAG TPA: hypothetical protein VGE07_00225 [Herpetosiphonaceae bacterium]